MSTRWHFTQVFLTLRLLQLIPATPGLTKDLSAAPSIPLSILKPFGSWLFNRCVTLWTFLGSAKSRVFSYILGFSPRLRYGHGFWYCLFSYFVVSNAFGLMLPNIIGIMLSWIFPKCYFFNVSISPKKAPVPGGTGFKPKNNRQMQLKPMMYNCMTLYVSSAYLWRGFRCIFNFN